MSDYERTHCVHVRQDLSYQPSSAKKDEDRKQRKQRKRDRLLSSGSSTSSRDVAVTSASSVMCVMNIGTTAAPVNGMIRSQRTHRSVG